MNNDSAGLQPPAYMTQMGHNSYQPNLLEGTLDREIVDMNYSASISADGSSMSLKFMNYNPEAIGLSTTLQNLSLIHI